MTRCNFNGCGRDATVQVYDEHGHVEEEICRPCAIQTARDQARRVRYLDAATKKPVLRVDVVELVPVALDEQEPHEPTEADDQRTADRLRLRPAVAAFADLMEKKLRENDHKGRRGWACESWQYLLARLCDEAAELAETISTPPNQFGYSAAASFMLARHHLKLASQMFKRDPHAATLGSTSEVQNTRDEAVDVGAFAMMIADLCDSPARTTDIKSR